MLKEILITTKKRNELIDITDKIQKIVSESGTCSGSCFLYCPHTTAGLIINENADPNVGKDLLEALEKMVPKMNFLHSEGNSDAHLKSALVGKEKTLLIEENDLVLGQWDAIYFAEFDGPRQRKVFVKLHWVG